VLIAIDSMRQLGYAAAVVALLALIVLRYVPQRTE